MDKKILLFDMDGVLINSEPQHYRAWKVTFRRHGLEIDFDGYKGCIGSTLGYLSELIVKNYGVHIPFDADLLAEYENDKKELEKTEGVPRVPGAVEVVRQLKNSGYTMAVASSSPQAYIERCMKEIGIDDCFSLLFSGERVAHSKPAPDTFLEAARLMKADPADCIVIEDSHNGTLAAKAAGMYCIGFVNPDSGDQDLSPADETFTDFYDLPGRI